MKRLVYKIGEEYRDMTLNAYMRGVLGMSMHFVRSVKFKEEGLCVNGQRVTTRYRLQPGDELIITMEDEANAQVIPTPGQVPIVFEDEDLVLVDKPAGMVVHPCHGHYTDTLVNFLAWHYQEEGRQVLLRPVGRLDKDTSGLLFVAKNKYASRFMENARKEGRMHRYYRAVVEGHPGKEGDQGLIDAPIEKDERVLNHYFVGDQGRPSRTYYEVIRCFEKEGKPYALVGLKLATGRTHQIRVHMAHIGHPLVGDPIYGHGIAGETRAMLHSCRIETVLPGTDERTIFQAEDPEDFRRIMGTSDLL